MGLRVRRRVARERLGLPPPFEEKLPPGLHPPSRLCEAAPKFVFPFRRKSRNSRFSEILETSRNSVLRPFSSVPKIRAGMTFVSFRTRTSPAWRSDGRSATKRWANAPVCRSSVMSRAAPRGAGRWAMDPCGSTKSKSATSIRRILHGRCARLTRCGRGSEPSWGFTPFWRFSPCRFTRTFSRRTNSRAGRSPPRSSSAARRRSPPRFRSSGRPSRTSRRRTGASTRTRRPARRSSRCRATFSRGCSRAPPSPSSMRPVSVGDAALRRDAARGASRARPLPRGPAFRSLLRRAPRPRRSRFFSRRPSSRTGCFFSRTPSWRRASSAHGSRFFLRGDPSRSFRRDLAAGALLGLAVISEYPAAVPAGVLVLCAVLPAPRRALALAAGGAPFVALLGAYDLACFGGVFELSSAHERAAGFRSLASAGLFGISLPSPEILLRLLADPSKGLLVFSPFLLLWPGALRSSRRNVSSAGRLALGLVPLSLLLLYAGYPNWHGGFTVGPRYLVAALPFLVFPFAFGKGGLLESALVGASTLAICATTLAFPFVPPGFALPWGSFAAFFFERGLTAPNALHLVAPVAARFVLPAIVCVAAYLSLEGKREEKIFLEGKREEGFLGREEQRRGARRRAAFAFFSGAAAYAALGLLLSKQNLLLSPPLLLFFSSARMSPTSTSSSEARSKRRSRGRDPRSRGSSRGASASWRSPRRHGLSRPRHADRSVRASATAKTAPRSATARERRKDDGRYSRTTSWAPAGTEIRVRSPAFESMREGDPSTVARQPGNIGFATTRRAGARRLGPHRPASRRPRDEKRVPGAPSSLARGLDAAIDEDPSVRSGIDLREVQPEACVQLRGAEGELRMQEQVLHAPGVERRASRREIPGLDDVSTRSGGRGSDRCPPAGRARLSERARRSRAGPRAGDRSPCSRGRNEWSGRTR